MSNNDPHKGLGPTHDASHIAGVGKGFFDWGALPALGADFMRSNIELFNTNMHALLDLVNPKLLMDSTRMGHVYAIAKHYMPEALLPQMPSIVQGAMKQMGYSKDTIRQMQEDELSIFLLEAMGNATWEEGMLYKPQYNHKFLAEDSHGEIEGMDTKAIVAMFQKAPGNHFTKPQEYARLVLTASHANAESLRDVTRITHGIEAMARDSWGKTPLNLAHRDEPAKPGQTLILFGCDTDRNAMLNGAALTRRIRELRLRELDGQPDTFEFMAPGAKRLSRLMLACMTENFFREDGTTLFAIDDLRPLSEIFAGTDERIHLSTDARRIAQHFQLLGYSKGGNVVSDAMRFMERDLMAVDGHDKGLVRTSSEEEDRGILRLKEYGVRSLLRNINTASIAARERPLTKEQKEHGLRRVAFNNKHDFLTNNYVYKSSPNDEAYWIEGTRERVGHDPEDCMGTREREGYALKDPRVARRMKEFFAPHYGRAAIANLFARDGELKMESAPGTPDFTMRSNEGIITDALTKAGLTNPQLVPNPYHIGIMGITADEDVVGDPAALHKVNAAFKDLRKNAPGVLIADKIIQRDVPRLVAKAKGREPDDDDSPGGGPAL